MITQGTILIEQGTLVPPCFRMETASDADEWMSLADNIDFEERAVELAATGWTFFYLAGEVRASAFGFDAQKNVHTALEKLIAGMGARQCNCIEIDEVATHTFFGVPWVSITAHSRRIQQGSILPAGEKHA